MINRYNVFIEKAIARFLPLLCFCICGVGGYNKRMCAVVVVSSLSNITLLPALHSRTCPLEYLVVATWLMSIHGPEGVKSGASHNQLPTGRKRMDVSSENK